MLELGAVLSAIALLLVAFALLALSQGRHWEAVRGSEGPTPRRRRLHRQLAWPAIALALPPCLLAAGSGLGTLLWGFLCFASAFAVALALTWRPRLLAPLVTLSSR